LTGAGQDRVVQFHLEGPGIQYGPVRALAREMKAPVEPRQQKSPYGPAIHTVHAAAFDFTATPSRLIRGVVRDKKTGRPVAGVEISSGGTTDQTRSDRDGRYELHGYGKSTEGYSVIFWADNQLYFSRGVHFPDTPGLEPVLGDVELISGIVASGKVTHKVTGKPLAEVRVHYNPLYPNPFVRRFGPNGAVMSPCSFTRTRPDGSFRLVVLPGPGVLGFEANSSAEIFMPALVTTQQLKEFFKDNEFHGDENTLQIQASVNGFGAFGQAGYNELVLINPAEKDETLTRDVVLQPARRVRGRIVGPDGKPLNGVTAYRLAPGVLSQPLPDDTFTVEGLDPRRTRQLVFHDKENKYGAFVTLKGRTEDPLTVRLEPCGSVVGRLLDQDGQPAAGATVRLDLESLYEFGPRVKTDRAGRFRIDGLVPGQKCQARLGAERNFGQYLGVAFAVKPGEIKDLGDVRVKPPQ
jgi:hypothetical protein